MLTRASDVQGLVKPNWDDVVGREYRGWDRQRLVVDTPRTHAEPAAERIAAEVARSRL